MLLKNETELDLSRSRRNLNIRLRHRMSPANDVDSPGVSSGAMIVQNIIFNLLRSAPQRPEDGTFGCTDTQAHIIIVDRQLQVMLSRLRFNGQRASGDAGSALGENCSIS